MRYTDFGVTTLDTELTEMMIQMFVHQDGPFHWCQGAKKGMWVGSADRWSARNESVDERTKAHPLRIQVAYATNDQFIHRRGVPMEFLIISDNLGLNR